jgi:PAS domain S-box-containing protein
VADNTYDWEFWLDNQGNFIYCSPSCQRITGYEASEFVKDPLLMERIIHPDDLEAYLEHRKGESAFSGVPELDFRIIRPDGSLRWIGHLCRQVVDEKGVVMEGGAPTGT